MKHILPQRHLLDVYRGPGMVACFTALKKETCNIDSVCSSKRGKVFI